MVRFGPFDLLRRLALTGLSEVFLAERRADGKRFAVKRLLPHAQEDEELVGLFMAEARLAKTLRHPNVVRVFEAECIRGASYQVQEFLDGITLRQLFRTIQSRAEILTEAAVLATGVQLARGLAYIHHASDEEGRHLGIVHRDLSPTNVMLTRDGTVHILDFGIATFRGRGHLTQPGIRKGKLAYMSPEQVRGEPLTGRSDVFAMGVILWELLTGTRLFRGADVLEIMERVEAAELPGPTKDESDFQRLLRDCMRRSSLDRPDIASDVVPLLTQMLQQQGGESSVILADTINTYDERQEGLPGHPVGGSLPKSAEERGEETTDRYQSTDVTGYVESPFSTLKRHHDSAD